MWIFTTTGFVSIVAHRERPGFLLVRARRLEHLTAFFSPLNYRKQPKPICDHLADYRWRVVMPAEQVSALVSYWVEQIDYPNFKERAAAESSSREYTDTLHAIWAAARRLQH